MKGYTFKKKRLKNIRVIDEEYANNLRKRKLALGGEYPSYSSVFLRKMFEYNPKFEMEDWILLFTRSITVKDFMSLIPHFRMFERMLSITSKQITGSKLKSFFSEFIDRMGSLDVSVIPLFFEWCYVLYRQKLIFSKNRIREALRYEILKNALLGIMHGNARNFIIMLIGCDLNTSKKYLFPNSQISNWNEEFEAYGDCEYSLEFLQKNFWSFGLDIFRSLAKENSMKGSSFELMLSRESTCLCKLDDWITNNSEQTDKIRWFNKKSRFLTNNNLLLILFSSFIKNVSFAIEFFPIAVELVLKTNVKYCNSNIGPDSSLKYEISACSYDHKVSFISTNILYDLIVYSISTYILDYYVVIDEKVREFNIIYEESFNILSWLTAINDNDYSSFYKYSSSSHLLRIHEFIEHFGSNPALAIGSREFYYKKNKIFSPLVILVFNSILNVYRLRDIQYNLIEGEDHELLEEILITFLFLAILHPSTPDETIIYLLNTVYDELYSFGFLLIGFCTTLLFRKNVYSSGMPKRVQLNISNFRYIHLIDFRTLPSIHLINCAYNLVSKDMDNFKTIYMIVQQLENCYLRFIRMIPKVTESKRTRGEIGVCNNISQTLMLLYMKLFEFFHLNPSIRSLFCKMKHCPQEMNLDFQILEEEDDFIMTNYRPKVSLLDIFPNKSNFKDTYNPNIISQLTNHNKGEKTNTIVGTNFIQNNKMNYTTMVHLLAILYTPIIKRVDKPIYKFKYSICSDSYLIGEKVCFDRSESEFDEWVYNSLIQESSVPKKFCIEYLEEVIKYCRNNRKISPFEIERFIIKNPLDTFDISSGEKSFASHFHTCENDKSQGKCFMCCIDLHSEYLGIINELQQIGGRHKNYHLTKKWANHATIISIIQIIDGCIYIDDAYDVKCPEINTNIRFSKNARSYRYDNIGLKLLKDLIGMLMYEISDANIIKRESGDNQRIIFRSILINLLIILLGDEIGREILSNFDLHRLLVGLCYLFSFRIKCLTTDICDNIEIGESNELSSLSEESSTPFIRTSSSSSGDCDDENDIHSTVPNNPQNVATPMTKRRITPIVISSSSNKRSFSSINKNMGECKNGAPCLALREDSNVHSCIFNLKIILNAISTIHEMILQDYTFNDKKVAKKLYGIQTSDTELVLNVLENCLFFLLPSNTISRRSIMNYESVDSTESEINLQDSNAKCSISRSSVTEESDNISDLEQDLILGSTNNPISGQTNVHYLLNSGDFSKEWYIEIVIYLIRFILDNNRLIKDISSMISDIASRIVLLSHMDNRLLIFKVSIEIIRFCHDYLYEELPEISLCLLRNFGFQLLQPIKFVFVAILDKNSLFDNTIASFPSKYSKYELEALHKLILIFNNMAITFDLCFRIIFQSRQMTKKDFLWLDNAVNLIDAGIDTLRTEVIKMGRIQLPPIAYSVIEIYDRNTNFYRRRNHKLNNIPPGEIWDTNLIECAKVLRECEYIYNTLNYNRTTHTNEQPTDNNLAELGADLGSFITFEQCDEGVLQRNRSYLDLKITPYWNTFIKSLFL
ncbi:transmembrane domain-containing protein [Cryptosporidium canis]|uniref:Transmembrane domain-containing protein n=1 Tax=Cryptosporidium canis TaxID=195482 RepID=A0ABQ8P8Y3_9CRYT|nr:transmembrane domain-containing protein [Cryptosporidium canis]KAJ1614801.1 transmembrane domain-containing protein [Cryptosporidium canis]